MSASHAANSRRDSNEKSLAIRTSSVYRPPYFSDFFPIPYCHNSQPRVQSPRRFVLTDHRELQSLNSSPFVPPRSPPPPAAAPRPICAPADARTCPPAFPCATSFGPCSPATPRCPASPRPRNAPNVSASRMPPREQLESAARYSCSNVFPNASGLLAAPPTGFRDRAKRPPESAADSYVRQLAPYIRNRISRARTTAE